MKNIQQNTEQRNNVVMLLGIKSTQNTTSATNDNTRLIIPQKIKNLTGKSVNEKNWHHQRYT